MVLCFAPIHVRATELVVTSLETHGASGSLPENSYEVTLNGFLRIQEVSVIRFSKGAIMKMPSRVSGSGRDYPLVVITDPDDKHIDMI